MEFTTVVDFFIGSTSTSVSSATFKGTFYGNVEVVGRAKFLQCERITDSVVGWYDLYSDTFYAPESGSTNPTKGNYVTDPVVVSVEGTDEVITLSASGVSDQTASVENLLSVGTYVDEQEIISGAVTRKCGVAVLNGEENISISNACFTIPISDRVMSKTALLCSHFPYSSKTST